MKPSAFRQGASGVLAHLIQHLHVEYNVQHFLPTSVHPPLSANESPNPHPPPLPTIQLGPNIQIKTQPATLPPIKINHILHPLPSTPLHHPIMPIKRPLIPQPPIHPRLRTHLLAIPAKTAQLRSIATSILLSGEFLFPVFDFAPCALVDGVVDGHDGSHVGGVWGVVLALHGFEEHLFGGVDPV